MLRLLLIADDCIDLVHTFFKQPRIESVTEGFFQLSTYTLLMFDTDLLRSVGQFRRSCRCSLTVGRRRDRAPTVTSTDDLGFQMINCDNRSPSHYVYRSFALLVVT